MLDDNMISQDSYNKAIEEEIKIENMIYEIRGKQVMLDSDLAKLYQCKNGTKDINKAVKRNLNKFPNDFYFQLTDKENKKLRFQNGTTNMSRSLPHVFTQEGISMLATVLKTEVAAEVSVRIMRTFVAMRKFVNENKDLFKLEMLKQELSKVQAEKEEVVAADSTEDYQKAADLKTRECQLIEEIDKLNAKMKPKQLTTQDIANVIENVLQNKRSQKDIIIKKIEEVDGALVELLALFSYEKDNNRYSISNFHILSKAKQISQRI